MGAATVPNRENLSPRVTDMTRKESSDWVRIAAFGSLVSGGLLLLAGQKRAGLVLAASGTALALLDHEDTLREWWEALPGYVDRAQYLFGQVRDVVENVTEKGEALRRVLAKA